jgi:tryptophan halogenase
VTVGAELIRVVVVGGGTAGWMSAAALARLLPHQCRVQLVESETIGIVGVGEATLPHIRAFNDRLGIDEADFMAATRATFKLGIEFDGWARPGDRYLHPFARFGRDMNDVGFHHYWTRARLAALEPGDIQDYSLPAVMCRLNRFSAPLTDPERIEAGFGYAYQFDANLYAPYLRRVAESLGATRTEGRVVGVVQDPEHGNIKALQLDDGRKIEGDLFIDCSGFRSLLVGDTFGEPFDDWSRWLPCDRAIAVPSATQGSITPYTSAIAMDAGWRWRIPLQHRTGNGYVHSSAFVDEQIAIDALVQAIGGTTLADPRVLRFTAGRRRRAWVGNCIAVGLSGGFLEPLESTSIYLIQVAITSLLELFPERIISDVDRDEFNRIIGLEYDRIRDFLILHYHATERDTSPFWTHVRTMTVPDSLQERIALFKARGRIEPYVQGLFLEPSWLAVLIGQRRWPNGYDARADGPSSEALVRELARMRTMIASSADAMPKHEAYIANYCATRNAAA